MSDWKERAIAACNAELGNVQRQWINNRLEDVLGPGHEVDSHGQMDGVAFGLEAGCLVLLDTCPVCGKRATSYPIYTLVGLGEQLQSFKRTCDHGEDGLTTTERTLLRALREFVQCEIGD